jgi:hypothetical protein
MPSATSCARRSRGLHDPTTGIWYLIDTEGAPNSFYYGDPGAVEPSEGGSPTAVSSITYDVVGFSDDAIKGYRLVIHATQAVDDGPYALHSVERTYICWRGVDADDLCV